ncbi:MAG: hypothetical protein MUD12_16450 [Spirochaetes bacterium]|jgi:hypothetical protein|nr:hypothetical protein [Spirochaetota bacterium]
MAGGKGGGGDGRGQCGSGKGMGRGQGAGKGAGGNGSGVTGECLCPACGATVVHQRGIPCTQATCPKCGTPMQRK